MKLRTLLRVLLVLVLMIIAGISAFRASVDDSLTDLRNSTTQRLEMYANSLDSEIGHYARLPSLLALSPMWTACCESLATNKNARPPTTIWTV